MSCRSPLTVPMTTVPLLWLWPAAKVGLEDLQAGLHGLGGHEHLGHEELAGAEAFAHLVHGADQPVVQNRADVRAAVQLRLGLGLYRLLVKCQYCVEDVLGAIYCSPFSSMTGA
jgi:hypothetical protein